MIQPDIELRDLNGNLLKIGDKIVFGTKTGCMLYKGVVTRLTTNRVHFDWKYDENISHPNHGFREPRCVVKID